MDNIAGYGTRKRSKLSLGGSKGRWYVRTEASDPYYCVECGAKIQGLIPVPSFSPTFVKYCSGDCGGRKLI